MCYWHQKLIEEPAAASIQEAQGSASSSQGSASSSQGSASSSQGSASPSQGSASPSQGSASSRQGSPPPAHCNPPPAQGTAAPPPAQGSPQPPPGQGASSSQVSPPSQGSPQPPPAQGSPQPPPAQGSPPPPPAQGSPPPPLAQGSPPPAQGSPQPPPPAQGTAAPPPGQGASSSQVSPPGQGASSSQVSPPGQSTSSIQNTPLVPRLRTKSSTPMQRYRLRKAEDLGPPSQKVSPSLTNSDRLWSPRRPSSLRDTRENHRKSLPSRSPPGTAVPRNQGPNPNGARGPQLLTVPQITTGQVQENKGAMDTRETESPRGEREMTAKSIVATQASPGCVAPRPCLVTPEADRERPQQSRDNPHHPQEGRREGPQRTAVLPTPRPDWRDSSRNPPGYRSPQESRAKTPMTQEGRNYLRGGQGKTTARLRQSPPPPGGEPGRATVNRGPPHPKTRLEEDGTSKGIEKPPRGKVETGRKMNCGRPYSPRSLRLPVPWCPP
ncbi:basic salivary proline-rich protein 1-like [Cyprinodon tularosa]|uniref:basic salivary proline-rich protein 1-like n=1 Tax=Cyprinodon tularosa TaxID=77115 RepID=UPI0018E27312|nr:basic salivary proline-rich protein 1-like [Cyprinodon tularosa]